MRSFILLVFSYKYISYHITNFIVRFTSNVFFQCTNLLWSMVSHSMHSSKRFYKLWIQIWPSRAKSFIFLNNQSSIDSISSHHFLLLNGMAMRSHTFVKVADSREHNSGWSDERISLLNVSILVFSSINCHLLYSVRCFIHQSLTLKVYQVTVSYQNLWTIIRKSTDDFNDVDQNLVFFIWKQIFLRV